MFFVTALRSCRALRIPCTPTITPLKPLVAIPRPTSLLTSPRSAAPFATLVSPPTSFLHATNLRPSPGSRRKKKRLGRGRASKGKTSGRGQKGYKARQNRAQPLPGFEGGQTGIIKAIPKLGNRGIDRPRFARLHLDALQHKIESKQIDPSKKITIRELVEAKAVGKVGDGVVLLARGGEFFDHKIEIEVTRASEQAIKMVEARGGKITTVYHGKAAMDALINPAKWAIPPKNQLPGTPVDIARYTDEARRGYLAAEVKNVDKSEIVKRIMELSRQQQSGSPTA
ncbi:ribosomal protein L18e/L15P [Gaertneriomyces semiglobifer]|nr:ribosomal protein L18e/L15P [Gaertneriomyces semiglobifer]